MKINFPMLLCGVAIVIAAVVYFYFAETLPLASGHKYAGFIIVLLGSVIIRNAATRTKDKIEKPIDPVDQ